MKKCVCVLIVLLACALCMSAMGEQLTISMIGDCTVGEQWCYRGYQSGFVYKITQAGLDYPFGYVADLFAADDLTLANCEVCFTNRRPADMNKQMSLYGPPAFAEVLRLGNVDVVNTINNHAMDFGAAGRDDTAAALAAQGIGYFGQDWIYETEVKGVRIGFVGYTYAISDYTLRQYRQKIEQMRADGCTFIVASVHWGREEHYELNGQQVTSGPALIDMGADLVFGHGPHVLQPIQYYKGKLILYSTANFTFGANSNPKDPDTAVFQVTYDIGADNTLTPAVLTAIPFRMHDKKDFRPYPFTEEADKLRVWRKLWRTKAPDSNLPESFLTTGIVNFTDDPQAAANALPALTLNAAGTEAAVQTSLIPTPVPTETPVPTATPVPTPLRITVSLK